MQTHLECVDLVFLLVFLSYWASVPTRTNFPFRQDFSPLSSPFLKASRCDLSFCSICHLGQIHINGRQKEKLFVFIIGLGATFCNPKKIYWTSMNILLKEKEPHWLFQWFIKCSSNYLASVHKESNPNNHISSTFYVPKKSQARVVSEIPRYTSLDWQHGLFHTFTAQVAGCCIHPHMVTCWMSQKK